MRALQFIVTVCLWLSPTLYANPKKSEEKPPLPIPTTAGSHAVGMVAEGKLYGASKIPMNGPSIAILGDHRDRHRGYTTKAMADLLTQTALSFRREHQRRVMLGDLSSKEGGKISGHKSHQNGLDVDIALFYLNKKGKPTEATAFVSLNESGVSKDKKLSFDALATWHFVLMLLEHPEVQVQYIFLYEPLCALVLEAGKAQGASNDLLERVDLILRQPKDASAHDDHMHLRIYCPKTEENLCIQTGPTWSFIRQ
jgi:penicillin-insensitive murein endopeptidase